MKEETKTVKVTTLPPDKSDDNNIRFMKVSDTFEDLGDGNFRKKPHVEEDRWQLMKPQEGDNINA